MNNETLIIEMPGAKRTLGLPIVQELGMTIYPKVLDIILIELKRRGVFVDVSLFNAIAAVLSVNLLSYVYITSGDNLENDNVGDKEIVDFVKKVYDLIHKYIDLGE